MKVIDLVAVPVEALISKEEWNLLKPNIDKKLFHSMWECWSFDDGVNERHYSSCCAYIDTGSLVEYPEEWFDSSRHEVQYYLNCDSIDPKPYLLWLRLNKYIDLATRYESYAKKELDEYDVGDELLGIYNLLPEEDWQQLNPFANWDELKAKFEQQYCLSLEFDKYEQFLANADKVKAFAAAEGIDESLLLAFCKTFYYRKRELLSHIKECVKGKPITYLDYS